MPAAAKTDRDTILQAALQRLRSEGLAALSWRGLAGDIGVAPNALYHHFPSRSDLEEALSEESARRLRLALDREMGKLGPAASRRPAERIRALSFAYQRFAQREPHLYAAMLNGGCDTDDPRPEHIALWELVCEIVASLHGKQEASAAAMSLWALLHGAVSLQRSGALAGTNPAECLRFGLNAWLEAASRSAKADA